MVIYNPSESEEIALSVIAPECADWTNKEECEAANCYWWANACHSEPEPLIPTAYIDSIYPNPAYEGDEVTFIGHGYDPDGTIVAYDWESDIVGFLSDKSTFKRSDLPIGEHTISFRVQDNDGNWSDPVTDVLIIEEAPPVRPIATIDSINPNPATEGDVITFKGYGYDPDGTVVAYEWSYNRTILSTLPEFTKADLPAGTYEIKFRVQDDEGNWSTYDMVVLVIKKRPVSCLFPRIVTKNLMPRVTEKVFMPRVRCIKNRR